MIDYKTEAIVLSSREIREYDRLYEIFSRERGKKTIIGIGTRKPQAKLASGLEPLTHSELFLIQGRHFDRVRGVIIQNQFENIKRQEQALWEAKKTAVILQKLLVENEPLAEIFDAWKFFLENLDLLKKGQTEQIENQTKLAKLALIWKTLKWSGYEPGLFFCAACEKKLEAQQFFTFFVPNGVCCQNCSAGQNSGVVMKKMISQDSVKILRIFLNHKIEISVRIKTEKNILSELEQLTKMTLENILGQRVLL